jgi:hypothetical protein
MAMRHTGVLRLPSRQLGARPANGTAGARRGSGARAAFEIRSNGATSA